MNLPDMKEARIRTNKKVEKAQMPNSVPETEESMVNSDEDKK